VIAHAQAAVPSSELRLNTLRLSPTSFGAIQSALRPSLVLIFLRESQPFQSNFADFHGNSWKFVEMEFLYQEKECISGNEQLGCWNCRTLARQKPQHLQEPLEHAQTSQNQARSSQNQGRVARYDVVLGSVNLCELMIYCLELSAGRLSAMAPRCLLVQLITAHHL